MRRRLVLSGLAALLVLVLAWLLRDFVRETLVVPLLYLGWLLRFVAGVIPQMLVWAVFLLIVLVLALRSLGLESPSLGEERKPPKRQRGRAGYWARRLKLAAQGQYSRWHLARELGDLAVDVLAQRGQVSPDQVRRALSAGEWPAPPDVQRYLQAAVSAKSYRAFAASTAEPEAGRRSLLDADVAHVVEFLEAQEGTEVH